MPHAAVPIQPVTSLHIRMHRRDLPHDLGVQIECKRVVFPGLLFEPRVELLIAHSALVCLIFRFQQRLACVAAFNQRLQRQSTLHEDIFGPFLRFVAVVADSVWVVLHGNLQELLARLAVSIILGDVKRFVGADRLHLPAAHCQCPRLHHPKYYRSSIATAGPSESSLCHGNPRAGHQIHHISFLSLGKGQPWPMGLWPPEVATQYLRPTPSSSGVAARCCRRSQPEATNQSQNAPGPLTPLFDARTQHRAGKYEVEGSGVELSGLAGRRLAIDGSTYAPTLCGNLVSPGANTSAFFVISSIVACSSVRLPGAGGPTGTGARVARPSPSREARARPLYEAHSHYRLKLSPSASHGFADES